MRIIHDFWNSWHRFLPNSLIELNILIDSLKFRGRGKSGGNPRIDMNFENEVKTPTRSGDFGSRASIVTGGAPKTVAFLSEAKEEIREENLNRFKAADNIISAILRLMQYINGKMGLNEIGPVENLEQKIKDAMDEIDRYIARNEQSIENGSDPNAEQESGPDLLEHPGLEAMGGMMDWKLINKEWKDADEAGVEKLQDKAELENKLKAKAKLKNEITNKVKNQLKMKLGHAMKMTKAFSPGPTPGSGGPAPAPAVTVKYELKLEALKPLLEMPAPAPRPEAPAPLPHYVPKPPGY